MHRRARHLNPANLGANVALDSRFKFSLSSGDAVSSWDDRSSNANNATQATSSNKPSYQTNIQGGQPAIRFDGTNDSLEIPSASNLNHGTGDFGVICLVIIRVSTQNDTGILSKDDYPTSPYKGWLLNRSDVEGGYGFSIRNSSSTDKSIRWNQTNISVDTPYIFSGTRISQNCELFVNGTSRATNTGSTANITNTAPLCLGVLDSNTQYGQVDLMSVIDYSTVSSPLRKRMEHSIAFSFKIACS